MMYRPQLNAGVPLSLIAQEFLPYLPVMFSDKSGANYTDNLSIEKLLQNRQLLKQIQLQKEEKQYQLQLKLQGVKADESYEDLKGKI